MSAIDMAIKEMVRILGKQGSSMIKSCDEVKQAIIKNSIGAAASSLASGFLPGVGATVATAISVGFIWRMYYQINQTLGISVSKNILKSVASALLTNLLTGLGAILFADIAATVLSLIPGLGSFSAAALVGAANYGLVYVSGLIYIKMLTGLFKAKKDISFMSPDEIATYMKTTLDENKDEIKEEFKEAKKSAVKDIKSGKITKDDSFDPEKE